jgi:hypothetical protein
MFAFDLILGKINCSELLREIHFNVNAHNTRNRSLIYENAHRTIYGFNEPLGRCLRNFSKFNDSFDLAICKMGSKFVTLGSKVIFLGGNIFIFLSSKITFLAAKVGSRNYFFGQQELFF